MQTPIQIVWSIHGSPRVEACVEHIGRCWMCAGEITRGQQVEKFSGDSFTGQNKVRSPSSTHVCEPCVWVCSRVSPVMGRPAKEGKSFGGNFRNYSALYEHGWISPPFGDNGSVAPGYVNASKGEKPLIREFLAMSHKGTWFAAIADSGQKHVLPWAPLNGPGRRGRVLFDETLVSVPDDQSLIADMMTLLTAGVTKDEIETGRMTPRAWQLAEPLVRDFEERRGPERCSSWFTLALWLAQRDEEQVATRIAAENETKKEKKQLDKPTGKRATKDSDDRAAPRAKSRVPRNPRSKRVEELGDTREPVVSVSADIGDARRVVDADVPKPPDPKLAQLGLFGLG